MERIKIYCPTCLKEGEIEVISNWFKNTSSGILALHIGKDQICPHSFVLFLDTHFNIRDLFSTDYQIDLPMFQLRDGHKIDKSILEMIKVDLIKLNISPLELILVLFGVLKKKSLILINNEEFLHQNLQAFFKAIFINSFDFEITIITENNFTTSKKQNAFIIERSRILSDKNVYPNFKELRVEKAIISNFFEETDEKLSLILLRNEIRRCYELSNSIVRFLKSSLPIRKLTSNNLFKYIKETFNVSLSYAYLDFVIQVVENYFNVNVPISFEISKFLEFV